MIEDSRIHGSLIQWLTIVNALWSRLTLLDDGPQYKWPLS